MNTTQNTTTMKRLSMAVAIATACYQPLSQAEGLVLEEVIVTAQKRMESVQDVPSTVNVIQGEKLDEYQIRTFNDIAQLTPGLSLQQVDPRNYTISLRGITFDPDTAAGDAVQVYWNGVAVRSNEAFRQIFDMQNIEVLRGPQGTLQGRTSPAGSIQLYTKGANLDLMESDVQFTASDNSGTNTQLAANIPIIDGVLGVRFAGYYDESDGLGVQNPVTGTSSSTNSSGGRISIGYEPNDELLITLVHQYQEEQTDAAEIVFGVNASGNNNPTLDYKDMKTLSDARINSINNITALTINWAVMGHEITSISGYRNNIFSNDRSLDYGNALPAETSYRSPSVSDFDIFSQELRIQSEDSENWEYLAGLYYERSQSPTLGTTTTPFDTRPALGPFGSLSTVDAGFDIPVDRELFGIFTHNKHYLSDEMSFQWGLRWQKIRSFNRADITTSSGVNALISDERAHNVSEAVTGNIRLSYDLTEDIMVYGSYDRGYRPGGITITSSAIPEENLLYEEETSNAIEFGFKSVLLDGRAQANGAIFYQTFDNFISRAIGVSFFNGTNAEIVRGGLVYSADAIVQGAELELTGLITEDWSAFLGVSYSDANVDNSEVPCIGDVDANNIIATCTVDGQRLGGEPNWSVSANSEYTVTFDELEWFTRGLFKYTGGRSNELVADADIGGYSTFDLFTGIRDTDRTWEVSLWAKNLTDKRVQTRVGGEDIVFITNLASLAPPSTSTTLIPSGYRRVGVIAERTVGITAKYHFE